MVDRGRDPREQLHLVAVSHRVPRSRPHRVGGGHTRTDRSQLVDGTSRYS